MINIKDEDTKLFEKNGFTKDDVGNTVNHYREIGLSDDDIQKKINIKIGMMRNPENVTPYMQIANNPNISQEEKISQLNALKAQEDEQNSVENLTKQYAQNKINEINQRKEAHPFLYGMNSMFNPVAAANDNFLQELAEKGKTTFAGTLKRGAMGGLTALGDVASVMSGGAALGANAAKLSNASKIARTMGAGGASFASPVATSSINSVINKELTPKEAAMETGKAFVEGAALAPLGFVSHTGVNNAIKGAMAKKISGEIAKEAVEKGYTLEKEALEHLTNKVIEAKSKQALTGALMETPSALAGGAVDTTALATMDYLYNGMQGKNQGTYLDQLKEYAPFMGFSALPIGAKFAMPSVRKVMQSELGQNLLDSINKSDRLSRRTAETRNALGLENSNLDNVNRYQEVDKRLQKVSGNTEKMLSREARKDIEDAGKVTKEEGEMLVDSWKNGNKQETQKERTAKYSQKFKALKQEAERLKQQPNVENQIVPYEQKQDFVNHGKNMAKTSEKVTEGINKPDEIETRVNEVGGRGKNEKLAIDNNGILKENRIGEKPEETQNVDRENGSRNEQGFTTEGKLNNGSSEFKKERENTGETVTEILQGKSDKDRNIHTGNTDNLRLDDLPGKISNTMEENRVSNAKNIKNKNTPELSNKYLNSIWAKTNKAYNKRISKVGAEKYLSYRFNACSKYPEQAQKFYNETFRKIKLMDEASAVKQSMLEQLNKAANKFASKNKFEFKQSEKFYGTNDITSPNNEHIKIVSEYLNNGNVSEKLKNIEVKASDLKDTCPDLKPFIEKVPDIKIKFENLPLGKFGNFNKKNYTITLSKDFSNKKSIRHEAQHAIDYEEIKNNQDNADLQAVTNHCQKVNSDLNNYEEIYKDTINSFWKSYRNKKENENLKNIIDSFGETEKQVINTYLQDYYEPYLHDIMETRARNAEKGVPCEKTLTETIKEFKQSNPTEWEKYTRENEQSGYFYGLSPNVVRFNGRTTRSLPQRSGRIFESEEINFRRTNGTLPEEWNEFLGRNDENDKKRNTKIYGRTPGKFKNIGRFYGLNDLSEAIKEVNERANREGKKSIQDVAKALTRGTGKGQRYSFSAREGNGNDVQRIRGIPGQPIQQEETLRKVRLNSEDRFHVIRDSKATEKYLIDLGVITEEQAKNRLLQQHTAGKGIYYQQFTNHGVDGIILNRDYQGERNSKKGWFGQKIKEGVRDKATVQDIVRNAKLRRVQAENIKEALDYIEQNFAEKIGSEGVKTGYVPVNKHLLANSLWGKTTKEWYKTIEKGEEAIKKAFKNEEQAQGWIELHNRTKTHDYQIPEELFNTLFDGRGENLTEYWDRYHNVIKSTGKLASTIADISNSFFKRRVLGTMSFVLNNRMNQMMIAAKSDSPADYLKSIAQAKSIKDIDLPSEILENSIAEAVEETTKRRTYTGNNNVDNMLNLFGGHVIDTKTLTGWKKLKAETANAVIGLPNKFYNNIADSLLKLNNKFETFERKQIFAQQLDKAKREIVQKTGQKMVSMQEAINYVHEHPEMKETIIRTVEDTLGDYNNFNKFERDFLKRIVPFYSWHRTMARHLLHLAKENPARCAMIFAEFKKLEEEDKDLKDYQKGSFRTPFKDKRSGKRLLINKVGQIPYNTPKEWFSSDSKSGLLSPLIKTPVEAVTGKKNFGTGEITNKRYVMKRAGKDSKGNPTYKYYDTKQKEYINSLPASTRMGYLGKSVFNELYPLASNNMLKGESLLQGGVNFAKTGKFLEPDKLYDADFGGFNHKDTAGYIKNKKGSKKIERYAAMNTSESTKILNRLGLGLQPQQDLNRAEKEALKERTRKYKAKHKKD